MIAVIVILIFLFKGRNSKITAVRRADSTSTTTAVEATQPDWSKVDFNATRSADADVTDPGIAVSGNDQYTIYTLGANILFATDDTTLQGSAGNKLNRSLLR